MRSQDEEPAMLNVGSFAASSCTGVSRRSFLKMGASLPAVLGLPALAAPSGRIAAHKVRAKSVLLVWMWGGPSHVDTFDPKPDAPAEYRGPFSPIATRTPGMRFTELMPRLAARSDKFTVIRSHKTSAPGHPDAGTVGLTGFAESPGPVQPSFGAIVAKQRGSTGGLPPYIAVGRGIPKDVVRIVEGWGGGKLGRAYDPLMVACSDEGQAELPSLKLFEGLTPTRLDDRRKLLQQMDTARRTMDGVTAVQRNQLYDDAFRLLTAPEARAAFDLSREPQGVREAYGKTGFGQSCLLGRRLVEAGVPFVQVNWSEYVEAMTPNCDFGWDTHIYNFELLQDRHGPIFDRAFAALLDDLQTRGLLETTLVVAVGEFGRSPKITNRAARDHWPRCYSSIWAGAGIAGGRVIGQSDPRGEDPITHPITPLAMGTTIAELAGMDIQARAEMNVLAGGDVIHEFF